jgi:hypothetical protein
MKRSLLPVCLAGLINVSCAGSLAAQPIIQGIASNVSDRLISQINVPSPFTQSPDVRNITVSQAKGVGSPLQEISVWRGAGTTISFIPVNEKIRKVWLDDPSEITVDFDSPLCRVGEGGGCAQTDALVIHLRRIKALVFPNTPRTRTTLLTVVTETSRKQRNLYQFRVFLATGQPAYSAVIVNPDAARQISLSGNSQVSIDAVEQGLQIAESTGLISSDQGNIELRSRVTLFLALLEKGVEAPLAANQAGVSLSLISRLAELGSGSPNSTTPTPNGSPNPTPTPNALPALP